MNLKAFSLALAILIAAATLYPPYLWGQEKIEEWMQLAQTGNVQLIDEYPKDVPRKLRKFLFSENIVEIQTGWGWDNQASRSTPRIERSVLRVDWGSLLLEYLLALCVAVIVGIVASLKSNRKLAKPKSQDTAGLSNG